MTGNRPARRPRRSYLEPKIGRMFLVSLALHLLVLALFAGVRSAPDRLSRPVYYVDLSRLPVADPQAGRPDARPPEEPKKPAAKPAPVAAKPPAAATKAKPAAKPAATVPAKAAPVRKGPSDADIARKIAAMSERQQAEAERQALKEKLAALAAADSRAADSGVEAPLGMPDARGTEAGVSQQAWLQAYLKEQWSLSRYQVRRVDLEAEAQLTFDADGKLLGYTLRRESGDAVFDDSVRAAVLKARQLPFKPGRRWQVDVVFNLKELLKN